MSVDSVGVSAGASAGTDGSVGATVVVVVVAAVVVVVVVVAAVVVVVVVVAAVVVVVVVVVVSLLLTISVTVLPKSSCTPALGKVLSTKPLS